MTWRYFGLSTAVVGLLMGGYVVSTTTWRAGSDRYEDLLQLHREFSEMKRIPTVDGFPDYSREALERREARLREFQDRLTGIQPRGWSRPQQVDWLLVQSELNDLHFEHAVRRPWSRDPGLYSDMVTRIPFTRIPLAADQKDEFATRLRGVPGVLERARVNLTEGAADLVRLALHNLDNHDGVGHGHPWRPVPPAGTIGWYQDLLQQLEQHHPELVPDGRGALAAVEAFREWLKQNESRMTAPAGAGLENFNWYLRYVKRMTYDDRDVLTIGDRELHRAWAFLAIERHKNRDLPPLDPSPTEEEYETRKREADRHIRDFIRKNEILTIPDYIGELDTNVPWIVRPTGRNFWEEIQFRDPRPDHVHAVIPGHRFDGAVKQRDTRPIRGTYRDGGRSEGWGFYLEEMFLQAGLLDELPRTKELFYIFQIKRAVRNRAELKMHANEWSVDQAVAFMREGTPFLDRDVARVDAEIYLRRPPGYGLSYQMGKLQLDQLLADRTRQLGDRFVLREFHDEFLAAGTIPISLIRYEMTGFDDEVKEFFAPPPPTGRIRTEP